MKMNPSMMKENYERQMGTKLSDEQFNNMMSMMNPEMLKNATQMLKQNPNLMTQARQQMQNGGVPPATFNNPNFLNNNFNATAPTTTPTTPTTPATASTTNS